MHFVAGLTFIALLMSACSQPQPAVKATVVTDPAFVEDCQPCEIRVSEQAGVYSFRFQLGAAEAGRTVRSIAVSAPGVIQTLDVKDMLPVAAGPKIFFGAPDINFDGLRDLMIMTSQGTANANAMYWLFDAASKKFQLLGEYPVFTIDSGTRHLRTYERGGAGGMIYEARQYAFVDGKLAVTRVEKQEAVEGAEEFRKTVEELREGKMVTVEKKTVRPPR
ncbi:MAG: hypothetical protein HY820_14675 [Acidobacteria bacterium]|nr:hypothetical protein [Acidobacteriota bacterium]